MKNINQFIMEKFKLNSKNISKKQYNYHPKNREELRKIISDRIREQKLNREFKNEILDLNDIDTSKIDSFDILFVNLNPLRIDISQWDVSNVKTVHAMFDGCEYLQETGDLGNWDISNIEDMSFMFNDCRNLKNIGDLSSWKINDVTMGCMFQNCKKIKNIGDISEWKPKEPNWSIFPLCPIKTLPRKRV